MTWDQSSLFFLGCQIFWNIILLRILWIFFYIYAVFVEIPPFSFLILFMWGISLFFLVSLDRFFQFCLPLHQTISWFYWFFSIFLISILLVSFLIFRSLWFPSFWWPKVLFVIFLILSMGNLRYWLEIYLLFWGVPISLWHALCMAILAFHWI